MNLMKRKQLGECRKKTFFIKIKWCPKKSNLLNALSSFILENFNRIYNYMLFSFYNLKEVFVH